MEDARFDRLARVLGRGVDRRTGLGAALAGVAAAVALGAVAEAKPQDEQCLRTGARCGKGSGNNGGPCKTCCSRHWTKGKKRKRCTCKPDGMQCNNSSQCCNGGCADGVCGGLEPLCIAAGGACPDGDLDCCDGFACTLGTCSPPVLCGPATCISGCCSDPTTCVPFADQSDAVCGTLGLICAPCGPSQTCSSGICAAG